MTKAVKEFLLDQGTGEVNVEYSDNTTTSFNIANAVTATSSGPGLGFPTIITAKRSNIVPLRIAGRAKSGGAGMTAHGCWPSPRPFTHVQLVFQGLTAATGISAKVASSATLGNGYSPKDGAGADVTPTSVTFGTMNPNDVTNPGGGAATGDIGAGSTLNDNNMLNATLYSDLIYCPSRPRTDGGSNFLAMTRAYCAGALPASSLAGLNPATADASGPVQSAEPDWAGGYRPGFDGITNFSTYTPLGVDWMSPAFVRMFCESDIITIAGYGDSTQTGWAPAGGPVLGGAVQGYIRTAIRSLFSSGWAVNHYNRAREGQKAEYFQGNALTEIPTLKPSVAIVRSWSINDGISQSLLDACISRLVRLAAVCREAGTLLIIELAPPQNLGASDDLLRIAFNLRLRNMGLPVLDIDALVTNGGAPASIRPELQTSVLDGVHFNRDGHDLIAQQGLIPLIKSIVSRH